MEPNAEPATTIAAAAATEQEPAAKPSPWRRGLRRLIQMLAWTLAGLLLLGLLAWVGLPPLLKWQIGQQAGAALGRAVTVEAVEFRPWSLQLELRGLRLADAAGHEAQFTLDRLYLDLEPQSLLRLAPVFDQVLLEGPKLRLRHQGEGRYDIDDLVARLLKPGAPDSAPPRFALSRFALDGGEIDFIDEPIQRTQQIRALTLKLPFLSNLPAQHEQPAEPHLSLLLNGDRIDASALLQPFAQRRQGKAELKFADLDLVPYLPYWPARLPLKPTRGRLGLELALQLPADARALQIDAKIALDGVLLDWTPAGARQALQLGWDKLAFEGRSRLDWPLATTGRPGLNLNGGRLQIDGAALREGDQARVQLGQLRLDDLDLSLREQRLGVGRLRLERPELQVQRDARGRWIFEDWLASAQAGTPPDQPTNTTDTPEKANQEAQDWALRLDAFELQGGRVAFADLAAPKPVRLQAGAIEFSAGPWSNTLPAGQTIPVDLALRLERDPAQPADSGALRYQGQVALAGSGPDGALLPLASQGRIELDALPLHLFEPYFSAALKLELLRAEIGLRADLALKLPPEGLTLTLRGDGAIEQLRTSTLEPTERLLEWKSLGLRGLQLDVQDGALSRLKIAETALSDYYARLVIDPQGRINLQQLLREPGADGNTVAQAKTNASPQKPAPATATAPAPRLEFGPIAFVRGQVDFHDHFIKPNYSAQLSELTGRLGGFSNQPARAGAAPELAALNLRGKAQGSASLEIDGQLNPLAQPLALDLRGKLDDLELPPLSPYSIKYAGHGIAQGKLAMEVRYQIAPDGQLQASNQIRLRQLDFGERVEGSAAPSLPLRLAVALLADSHGVIDLDLPVNGSINDPQFRVGPIVWRMVLGLIGKAVTAPFALIAHALGGQADESNQIDFAAGSAALDAGARERLQQIAQAMQQRPGLRLTLTGSSDLDRERSAYQKAQLRERLIEAKRRELLRTGQNADVVELGNDADYSDWLTRVYQRADIPKPRNLLGLARTLPTAEMEGLLLASIPVDADRMRELALARAAAVRTELIAFGIASERVFLGAPQSSSPEAGTIRPAAVTLALKIE